jgi:hypothetical protein
MVVFMGASIGSRLNPTFGRRFLSASGGSFLSGHLFAGCCTCLAGGDAFVHIPYPLAVRGALSANLGAFAAGMLVVRRIDQHEMCRGPANFGTRHHQAEMRRFGMLATSFEAMVHGGRQTGPVAGETGLDAAGHFYVHGGPPAAQSFAMRDVPKSSSKGA